MSNNTSFGHSSPPAPSSTDNEAPLLRLYDDAIHRRQVCDICKNVYGGTDRIPKIIADLAASPRNVPLVLLHPVSHVVIAFANLARLSSRANSVPIFLLEAVRVAENCRGRGLGTTITSAAKLHAQCLAPSSTIPVRIVTTTIESNTAMCRIFAKLQFLPRGISHIWPSHSTIDRFRKANRETSSTTFCTAHLMLDELGIALLPRSTTMRWTQVTDKHVAYHVLRDGSVESGYDLLPSFYCVKTVNDVIDSFLDPKAPGRSMWVLQGKKGPTHAIILVAISGNGSDIADHSISAVVSDVASAELIVSFLADFPHLGAFHIVFDMALTSTMIAQSSILSSVPTSPFLIYESSP